MSSHSDDIRTCSGSINWNLWDNKKGEEKTKKEESMKLEEDIWDGYRGSYSGGTMRGIIRKHFRKHEISRNK